jgi:hypothetical protein
MLYNSLKNKKFYDHLNRVGYMIKVLLSLIVLFAVIPVFSNSVSRPAGGKSKYLQGYAKDIKGGGFSYHTLNPLINEAMLIRANKLMNRIEWESEIVPADYKDETVTFIWLFNISRENLERDFHLTAGNKFKFDFHNQLGRKTGTWSIKGINNSLLIFKGIQLDRNDDLMGIAVLELPADEIEKGKPLHFSVDADDAQSQEWYMTVQGEVKEEINLSQTDCVLEKDGREYQAVSLRVFHIGGKEKLTVTLDDGSVTNDYVQEGYNIININIPRITGSRELTADIKIGENPAEKRNISLRPVKEMTVYILNHSHTDVGYTEIQTAIEEKQMQNLKTGIEFARRTADYPEGARFVWNVEVSWAADLFLKRMSQQDKADFYDAVKKGQVALNGMYLNVLTGLCRPEELLRLFKFSTELENMCGVKIDAAMTSDIPGQTWGTVTAMAQAGIKYFSTAPNYFDRIGDILVKWENRPFYWVSPSGKEKVLVWIPYKGYALSHGMKNLDDSFVYEYMNKMAGMKYPYDIAHIRWSGHGDNAVPEIEVSDFVKGWNSKYKWPKFIISSAGEAFGAFEEKYGDKLPSVKGDWTPYWEDGAATSAYETAMNRASSERLTQAEALWTMLDPGKFPVNEFEEAWRKILLYSEHTWGAWCSVSDPESRMTKEQWDIKQSYAFDADKKSKTLLQQPFVMNKPKQSEADIFNTSSWPRTELVIIPAELSSAGDKVTDAENKAVPSQRLSDGSLAVMAEEIPPFSSKRYKIEKGEAFSDAGVAIEGNIIDNGIIRLKIDETTGTITELSYKGISNNFAEPGRGLNGFLFLPGENISDVKSDSNIKITVKENGPLVASLLIESEAPSCNKLQREVRLAAGSGYVEIINTVDKKRAEISPVPGDGAFAQKGGKESLNFAFPFNVKNGRIKLDIPLGIMEPEKDQVPGSCRNWLTAGRWADVSNDECGIYWSTTDAPLIELGELTANLTGSQTDPAVWRKKIEPTQTLYSWVMNNHWSTNFRAYQDGIVNFRYALKPHREFSASEASKFSIAQSQPLVVVPAGDSEIHQPLLKISPDNIIVTSLKPADDTKGIMISVFNCSDKNEKFRVDWPGELKPSNIYISNTAEERAKKPDGSELEIAPQEVIILRAEF